MAEAIRITNDVAHRKSFQRNFSRWVQSRISHLSIVAHFIYFFLPLAGRFRFNHACRFWQSLLAFATKHSLVFLLPSSLASKTDATKDLKL
jgi:hypothetical protein